MAGEYYLPLYLIVVSVMTVYLCSYYKNNSYAVVDNRQIASPVPTFIVAVALTLFIGLRPKARCFVDSNNYIAYYNVLEGNNFEFNIHAENPVFDNLFSWAASIGLGWSTFFLLIAFVYFMGIFVACAKIFPYDTLVSYIIYLGAFSTFSYATNGIKAGAAASLFLMAIAYREKWQIVVLFLLLSLGFHHSMTLPIGAFVLAYFYRNTKVYFIAWCLCMLIAMLHISFFTNLLVGMTDERGAEYLLTSDSEWGGKSGFRIDFVLYSAMPVLVGYWTVFKEKAVSVAYNFILSIYLITNGVWMLCMYANYTNRIAYLSWFLYPIVLIYPFLNMYLGENQYRNFAVIACLHLLFTLFMSFIYY